MHSARGTKSYHYYRIYFPILLIALVIAIAAMIILVIYLQYQVEHRPLPSFTASNPARQQMTLKVYQEPNLMPNTIISWVSRATIDAYTFKFSQTDQQIYRNLQSYFTDEGANAFYSSLRAVLTSLKQKQLITNCAINGPVVIANQGDYPGKGKSWRVQVPFLVTYEGSGIRDTKSYRVNVLVLKVPTTDNPAGIAIDQFRM